jgi:pSer/pThr/pTyr-binding forkhead associated (FHA) protein
LGTRPLVVGRGEFADAFVEDDALSRSHFLVTNEGTEFCLIDLHSRNGTWVNGERVSAHKLQSHEIITAGDSMFYFSDVPIAAIVLPGTIALPKNSRAIPTQSKRG